MLGHLAVPPARQWLPAQQAPQSDRGKRTIDQTFTSTFYQVDSSVNFPKCIQRSDKFKGKAWISVKMMPQSPDFNPVELLCVLILIFGQATRASQQPPSSSKYHTTVCVQKLGGIHAKKHWSCCGDSQTWLYTKTLSETLKFLFPINLSQLHMLATAVKK